MQTVNVICIKWGTLYSPTDVNRLKNMVLANTSRQVKFHCFTDTGDGLDDDIAVLPIPEVKVDAAGIFKRETAFFSKNLGGLDGQRVFYFDLDVLVVNGLDDLFAYPKDDDFYIIDDWASKGHSVGQGSCFSWVVGDRYNDITTDYEENKAQIDKKYGSASQEYLSDKIIAKQGALKFWPEGWFRSFRFHCLPHPLMRHFQTPPRPQAPELKVIVFHGTPNPEDALVGKWPSKSKHRWKLWKKLYKHVRPTPWIAEYWK